jgi:hypothetical protein
MSQILALDVILAIRLDTSITLLGSVFAMLDSMIAFNQMSVTLAFPVPPATSRASVSLAQLIYIWF